MLSPVVGNRGVCDVLANPARSSLAEEARGRLDAWLGIHLFHTLARGGVLSISVLEDWETLRRTGSPRANTPASWVGAAKCMPLDAREIEQMLPKTRNERLQDALKLTLVALLADIPDPETLNDPGPQLHVHEPQAPSSNSSEGRCEDPAGDDEESDSKDDKAPTGNHSLMGLLLHRALHAGYRGQFGVTGTYGELPTPNLRRTCMALAATLTSGSESDRTLAAMAEVSLKLPLAPRRTLSVPLQCNDDIWLDLPNRSVFWNFDRILVSHECDPEGADGQGRCKPIGIRLSDECVSRLRQLDALRPSAASLRTLLGIGDDDVSLEAWLSAYGVFLRSHGESNYKAYSVRFARSYRSVYLERGHGAVAAAMLGLDLATAPGGLLHYISIPQERMTAWQMDVDSHLGLHWTAGATRGAR
jgi:hypothetical protein